MDVDLWKLIEQDATKSVCKDVHESRVMESKMPAKLENVDPSNEGEFLLLDDDEEDEDDGGNDKEMANEGGQGYQLNEHVVPGEDDFNNDGYLNVGVNTKMRDSFEDFCDKAHEKHLPHLANSEARGIRLLDMMKRKKTALDTYDEIMLWHYRESGQLDEFETLKDAPDHVSRDALLTKLTKRYHMEGKFPHTKTTTLPYSQAKVDLVCHDAWGCIESMLTDPRLTDDDFWFFDNDPFAGPPEKMGVITDLQTGAAYREAYKLYKKKPNQIVLPICMYLDGANTGSMKNMPITALKMTLGIFTRKYRDLDHAWKVLGHVHHISKNQAKANKVMKDAQHLEGGCIPDKEANIQIPYDEAGKSRDLHAMLDVILESYREVQKKGFMWDLRYRGKTYKDVEFIPFVIFMKCDTEEGDLLCGSYTNRTINVAHLCRYCTCPTNDTDNPQARYSFKTVQQVKAFCDAGDLDALKAISQKCIDNAWYKIRFSPINNRGIHGATPSEMLHAILLGNFAMLRNTIFEQLGPTSKYAEEMDHLGMLYGMQFARQSERDMPKCKFSSGIREGKLNAKEYRGILLVIAAVLRSTKGRKELNGKLTRQQLDEWLELIEIVLCWEAFLCQSEMTVHHVSRLHFKNRYLMWMIKKIAHRSTGMGLKLMKFHAIVHLCSDIILYGIPMELDTGSLESGHKGTKGAARTTQKNAATFDLQTSTRLAQYHVIDMGMQELKGWKLWDYYEKSERLLPDPPDPPEEIHTGGTTINILPMLNKEGSPSFSFGEGAKAMNTPIDAEWDRDILNFLYKLQKKLQTWVEPNTRLKIHGEHTRNGITFRGHPRYRDKHWRDWVIADWGGADAQPAHVWCFIWLKDLPESRKLRKKRGMVYGECHVDNGVYAVVEAGEFQEGNNLQPKSRLFTRLVKEMAVNGEDKSERRRKFFLLDTEAILEPAYVIPDVGCKDGCTYFHVKNRSDWILEMEKWLQEPNPQEYTADPEGKYLH